MKISVKFTKLILSVADRGYIEKKAGLLEKYIESAGDSVHAYVEIERNVKHRSGDVFRAEIQLRWPGGDIRAESRGKTWRIAFDGARKKTQREIVKHKGKKNA